MNDRTLLHIVLTLTMFTIALNAYTMIEVRQLGSRTADESIGTPPNNGNQDIIQGGVPTLYSSCQIECMDVQETCKKTCTNKCRECLDPCAECLNSCEETFTSCYNDPPCDSCYADSSNPNPFFNPGACRDDYDGAPLDTFRRCIEDHV